MGSCIFLHRLHLLSSAQTGSSFNDSKNNGVHSFVDENDENNQLEATPRTETATDASNLITPTKCKTSEGNRINSANDSILANESCVLSMSQMMLTSYVASENRTTPRILHSKRESAAYSPSSPLQTPKSLCSTPSSAAFQPIDQNENSPSLSASFAILKSPTTPTPDSRISKSMYLIDLTTPKGCSRHLLKAAIENAAHKTVTKMMNTSVNTFSVSKPVGTKTPRTSRTPNVSGAGKRSNIISSTPKPISSEEKTENENSEELIATGNLIFFYSQSRSRKNK